MDMYLSTLPTPPPLIILDDDDEDMFGASTHNTPATTQCDNMELHYSRDVEDDVVIVRYISAPAVMAPTPRRAVSSRPTVITTPPPAPKQPNISAERAKIWAPRKPCVDLARRAEIRAARAACGDFPDLNADFPFEFVGYKSGLDDIGAFKYVPISTIGDVPFVTEANPFHAESFNNLHLDDTVHYLGVVVDLDIIYQKMGSDASRWHGLHVTPLSPPQSNYGNLRGIHSLIAPALDDCGQTKLVFTFFSRGKQITMWASQALALIALFFSCTGVKQYLTALDVAYLRDGTEANTESQIRMEFIGDAIVPGRMLAPTEVRQSREQAGQYELVM